MTSPPTVCWLYYLVSAWGKSAQEEHVLLALAMKILMENPSVEEAFFEGTSLRAGERLPIYVVEESEFGYEETMAFWRSIGEPVRPMVQYPSGHRHSTGHEADRAANSSGAPSSLGGGNPETVAARAESFGYT